MEKLSWKERLLCECLSLITACWVVILFFLIYVFINYLWIVVSLGIAVTVVAEIYRSENGKNE